MDQIIPGLWIGDLACALATDYLSIAGITHIVTALKQRLPTPIVLPDGRTIDEEHVYHINLDDVDNAPILVHFPGAIEFIDRALQHEWIETDELAKQEHDGTENDEQQQDEPPLGRGPGQWATMGEGTVLVHCHAGISRSVAVVVAYLMHVRRMTRQDALRLVRSRRSQADPNAGFMHQLELYESGGYSVDVRNQRIRRFLMSQSSILRGDPIDDVMLSYYPSPFHSPASSLSGGGGGGAGIGGLQLSTLEGSGGGGGEEQQQQSRPGVSSAQSSRRGSIPHSGSISPISSLAMSRQNSRMAASSAAAKDGKERHRRSRSRSEGGIALAKGSLGFGRIDGGGGGGGGAVREMTTPASEQFDLSKSPPMPARSADLFDSDDDSTSSAHRDEKVHALIRQSFSSVRDPHEVMITVSSGNLPGGVNKVRGNQTGESGEAREKGPGSASGGHMDTGGGPSVLQRLPKPHFVGRKLRCKMCRRELAAQDHVVEHEAGKGKDAFDVRKREKDVEQKSRDGRAALGGGSSGGGGNHTGGDEKDGRSMSMEERFGAQRRSTVEEREGDGGGQEKAVGPEVGSTFKSAASLSAQLPPHLAALRLGRGPAAQPSSTSATANVQIRAASTSTFAAGKSIASTSTSSANGDLRKLLHSSLCTSYFVEPLAWMSALKSGEIAGRLDCPNHRCSAKLGSWDWAGMQCACGAWVTPAFALHRSKVDEV